MSDVITTITISLKHDRALTEAEFKNLTGNIFEHIEEEHSKDPGDWGFADIVHVGGRDHHQVDGKDVVPDRQWGWTLHETEPAA